MAHCMVQDYHCSNSKCRRYRNRDTDVMPVKDNQKTSNNFKFADLPCEPPDNRNGEWDLQYCKWSGWTWVRKNDREVIRTVSEGMAPNQALNKPDASKNNKVQKETCIKKCCGCFKCCFTSKNPKQVSLPSSGTQIKTIPVLKKSETDTRRSYSENFGDCCCCEMDFCCACQACPCSQMCCPCMNQMSYCNQEKTQHKCQNSQCMETQTTKDVKEQATKMSEIQIPKRKICCHRKRRCSCRRPICCPCMRNVCCNCCPCKRNQNSNSSSNPNNVNSSSKMKNSPTNTTNKTTEQLINYCLQNSVYKPGTYDFLTRSSPNFSTLHKSLDLLLKNNINIMGLFDDRKEINYDKLENCPGSNHTITCLSFDNLQNRSDPEHCKLLTAVCDAILSSHKFDNKTLHPTIEHSKSVHKNYESKDLYNKYNLFSSRGLLEKILTELNFTTTKNDDIGSSKDMGVQVNKNILQRSETYQPKRSLTKLTKNRSRILLAPRFPKRVEALRKNIDFLRFGYHDSSRKRNAEKRPESRIKTENYLNHVFKTTNNDSNVKKQLTSNCESRRNSNNSKLESSLKLENLESLLDSIEYLDDSSTRVCPTLSGNDKDNLEAPLNSQLTFGLLDATPPPFTESENLLNNLSDQH